MGHQQKPRNTGTSRFHSLRVTETWPTGDRPPPSPQFKTLPTLPCKCNIRGAHPAYAHDPSGSRNCNVRIDSGLHASQAKALEEVSGGKEGSTGLRNTCQWARSTHPLGRCGPTGALLMPEEGQQPPHT